MAKTYSVADARSHLPEILDEIEMGKDIHLTRRGRLVGVVLSAERYDALRAKRASFAGAYARFLEQHSMDDLGFETSFFEALRDRRAPRDVDL
jgi:prevent-host-death family protein